MNEKKITPIKARLEAAALKAQNEEIGEIVFQNSLMTQVGFPRKKVDGETFERTCGAASIHIQSGYILEKGIWKKQVVPYGPKVRLAQTYIDTQIKRTENQKIEIGNSYRAFLRLLNLSEDGKTPGLFKKQMNALAGASIKFGFTNSEGVSTMLNVQPIKSLDIHYKKNERQAMLWPQELMVHEDYKKFVLEHAVPLPMNALAALSHSALSLDIASWFARRLPTLKKTVRVPYQSLKEQFGQEYEGKYGLKNFKSDFRERTKEVLKIYPDAKVRDGKGYIDISPSKPMISKSLYSIPLPLPLDRSTRPEELTDKTLAAFRRYNRGFDPYACKADFDAFLMDRTFPDNYQSAFIAFAKKWAKNQL